MVPVQYYLALAGALFAIGTVGVALRRNVIVMFMSIELMLNAANLAFVALARALHSMDGQVIVFFVMTVAAAEAAVGLAIILASFRNRMTLDAAQLSSLKW
ncbi:MAG: NADH-quinone oxidoreductase subunit NuoK [Candidatus Binatia bacterium]|jgi:NADH-quinone oxidoreductase subunit K